MKTFGKKCGGWGVNCFAVCASKFPLNQKRKKLQILIPNFVIFGGGGRKLQKSERKRGEVEERGRK